MLINNNIDVYYYNKSIIFPQLLDLKSINFYIYRS